MKIKLISLLAVLAMMNLFCKKNTSGIGPDSNNPISSDSLSINDFKADVKVQKLSASSPDGRRTELQNLINSYAAKKQQLILPAGNYIISDEIILPSNLMLAGSGTQTQISLTSGSKNGRNVFRIPTRTSSVVIKNIIINANQSGNTGADLVALQIADNTSNMTFENVTFAGGRDRGSVQVKGLNAYQVKTLKFLKCNFKEAGRTSIELRGTKDVIISDCTFKSWGSQNPNSPAIQLQSQDNNNIQIIRNSFNNIYGKQFAIECAAAYVNDSKIIDNKLNDPNNLGGNGISGYYKRTEISKNIFTGGNGNQRSGLEIFGQHNILSYNKIPAGSIAIAPGIKEIGLSININNNQIKTKGANIGGIQMGNGCCSINDVKVTNNTIDTRLSSGNSSGIVVGTYGIPQVVSNVTIEANTIYTNAHCIRLQALAGSKDIYLLRNVCKVGYSWLGIITNTFKNIKAVGNVKELSNKKISYSVSMPPVNES